MPGSTAGMKGLVGSRRISSQGHPGTVELKQKRKELPGFGLVLQTCAWLGAVEWEGGKHGPCPQALPVHCGEMDCV